MESEQTSYAGIDVSKGRLDVVLRPSGEYLGADNGERGIGSLVASLGEAPLTKPQKPANNTSIKPPLLSRRLKPPRYRGSPASLSRIVEVGCREY
jgi:hypothetical protein